MPLIPVQICAIYLRPGTTRNHSGAVITCGQPPALNKEKTNYSLTNPLRYDHAVKLTYIDTPFKRKRIEYDLI